MVNWLHSNALTEFQEHLFKLEVNTIWHFHQYKDGRILMVDPNKKTRLCVGNRCALVQVGMVTPLDDYRNSARQIFHTNEEGKSVDVLPELEKLNKQAEKHGITVAPHNTTEQLKRMGK